MSSASNALRAPDARRGQPLASQQLIDQLIRNLRHRNEPIGQDAPFSAPYEHKESDRPGSETAPSPVDRGRLGSKHHLILDARGIPLASTLSGGNRHDSTQLEPLLERIPRVGGRLNAACRRPQQLLSDRATTTPVADASPRKRDSKALTARRQTEHGSGLSRNHCVVERTFAWLQRYHRLAIRYHRHAHTHEASSPSPAA